MSLLSTAAKLKEKRHHCKFCSRTKLKPIPGILARADCKACRQGHFICPWNQCDVYYKGPSDWGLRYHLEKVHGIPKAKFRDFLNDVDNYNFSRRSSMESSDDEHQSMDEMEISDDQQQSMDENDSDKMVDEETTELEEEALQRPVIQMDVQQLHIFARDCAFYALTDFSDIMIFDVLKSLALSPLTYIFAGLKKSMGNDLTRQFPPKTCKHEPNPSQIREMIRKRLKKCVEENNPTLLSAIVISDEEIPDMMVHSFLQNWRNIRRTQLYTQKMKDIPSRVSSGNKPEPKKSTDKGKKSKITTEEDGEEDSEESESDHETMDEILADL